MALGIRWLAEAVDCLGDQLRFLRDMKMGIRAALLLDYLRKHYPQSLDSIWPAATRGSLITDVAGRLHITTDDQSVDGLTALQDELDKLPRVVAALENMDWDVFDVFSLAPK